MVILIAGQSHTGKTLLAQRLLEKYHYPYFSIDHLKMGLIRSGQTTWTPEDDDQLTAYLWPIVKEMIKTVIENRQNLIIEGCYIPYDYQKDFAEDYLEQIEYRCLIFSEDYIQKQYPQIMAHANVIEQRKQDNYPMQAMIRDNAEALQACVTHRLNFYLIDAPYDLADIF